MYLKATATPKPRPFAKPTRRRFAGAALSLGLASCSTGGVNLGVDVVRAFRYAAFGVPDVEITRENINQIPYATIAAKIGKGPRSLLVLWRVEREDLHWISADNAVVVTRRGRVVRTAGLPATIRDTDFQASDPLASGQDEGIDGAQSVRVVDFEPDGPLTVGSSFHMIGPRTIEIAGIRFDTVLFEERCIVPATNWTFTNRYWRDPSDGFVWRSEQTIARQFPPIQIEVLKPADI
jgi:hypothetical protein